MYRKQIFNSRGKNMIIEDIKVGRITVPLKKPFKTKHGVYNFSNEVVVKIYTSNGILGIGSAAPAPRVTGETESSIVGAIKHIAENIKGLDLTCFQYVLKVMDECIRGNNSAKAAVEIAIYDLWSKHLGVPLYKLLGGFNSSIVTDMTIMDDAKMENMVNAAYEATREGYTHIKIKLGNNIDSDFEKVKFIRRAIPKGVKIRVDGNQGWTPKEAVRLIKKMEQLDLDIEFVEQPVKAWDVQGLRFIKDNVDTMIVADESVFGSPEAFRVIQDRACDLINIKLMKCGGIQNATKIYNMADTMGIRCMVGCMLESKIGITAAASFAASKGNMIIADLDTIIYFADDPIVGGVTFEGNRIMLPEEPGLGIKEIRGWEEIL
ncbi:dipeptide epimerase [Clostridium culturomicium]|uniref:dipeptide epimerase n=2 Tax=Clostridium culturomicium TaxID=1499683 RepID=UPI001F3E5462|nr:dipeptide epimerase [Clostridium culturomicium]